MVRSELAVLAAATRTMGCGRLLNVKALVGHVSKRESKIDESMRL